MADLDEDEKWLARTYFPMLIAESESLPDHLLEGVAEVAEVFGTRAMRRVLHRCSPAVRASLLMIVLSCLPTEVYSDQSILSVVERVQTTCNSTVTL